MFWFGVTVARLKKMKRVIFLMVHGRAMSVLVLRGSLPFELHFIARHGERLDSALSSAAEQSGSMQHTSMRKPRAASRARVVSVGRPRIACAVG